MDSQHKAQLEEQIGLANDFRDIFLESPQGQRVLEHLKNRFHYRTSTATADLFGRPVANVNRQDVLNNEGQRSVVLYILGMAEMDVSSVRAQMSQAEHLAQEEDQDLGV